MRLVIKLIVFYLLFLNNRSNRLKKGNLRNYFRLYFNLYSVLALSIFFVNKRQRFFIIIWLGFTIIERAAPQQSSLLSQFHGILLSQIGTLSSR